MSSWVRYAVAVYIGLLISGALARPPMSAPSASPVHVPSVHYEALPIDPPLPPVHDPAPATSADVSV